MPGAECKAPSSSDEEMKVYLSENAFIDLLLSSAEVYKKESLGFLLGYKPEDRFIVEHAFSFQSARRKHKGVIFHHKNHKKIEPILEKFDRLQIIGDFHSHTQFGVTKGLPIPSDEDIREMREGHIYLIVAINNNEKTLNWGENRDGSISGSVGNFFFKIAAYFLNGSAAIKRARIHCPFPPEF